LLPSTSLLLSCPPLVTGQLNLSIPSARNQDHINRH